MNKKVCYHGGSSFNAIGSDFSNLNKKDKIIRADVTDAWYEPAPIINQTLSCNLNWLLRNSPPTYSEGLIKTISKTRGVPEDNLLAGGGSSDLMFLFFQNFFKKGDKAIVLDPMYGEYAHLIKDSMQGKIIRVKQKEKNFFRISLDEVLSSIDSKTSIVVLVNPNNPTGQFIKRKEIIKLLNNMSRKTVLFIDETYIDYVGKKESVETLASKYDNLVVLKSMSKIYGLSGTRIGYMCASKKIITKLISKIPPWSIGSVGQLAAILALKNENYYYKKIEETKRMRDALVKSISEIHGLKPIPSVANFVLIELIDKKLSAQKICNELHKRGIFIRNPKSQSIQLGDRFIRISVKSKHENERIIKSLRQLVLRALN